MRDKPVDYRNVKPGDVVIAQSKEIFSEDNRPAFWVFVVKADDYDRDGLGSQAGFWPAATHDFFVVGDGYATITSSATVCIQEVDSE